VAKDDILLGPFALTLEIYKDHRFDNMRGKNRKIPRYIRGLQRLDIYWVYQNVIKVPKLGLFTTFPTPFRGFTNGAYDTLAIQNEGG